MVNVGSGWDLSVFGTKKFGHYGGGLLKST